MIETDANRVIRGGSWNNSAQNVRAAYRNANHPEHRNDNLGFRCLSSERAAGWLLDEHIIVQSAGRDAVGGEQKMAPGVLVAKERQQTFTRTLAGRPIFMV